MISFRPIRRITYYKILKLAFAYLVTRFKTIFVLWMAIFFGAKALNGAVNIMTKGKYADVIRPADFLGFADDRLLVALVIGVVAVLLIHRLLKNALTTSGDSEGWGEESIGRAMDEISAAATHFACVILVSHIFANDFQMSDKVWLAISLLGIAIYTFDGKANYENFDRPRPAEYEATITHPVQNAAVSQMVRSIRGSIYKKPPKGYSLWLVRRWSADATEFYPMKEINFAESNAQPIFFDTFGYVGGQIDRTPVDERFIELWLVGEQGSAVFEAWMNGNARFVARQGDNFDQRHLYPGLVRKTDDMVIVFSGRRVTIHSEEELEKTQIAKAHAASLTSPV
ncbi:hypothetical protein [Paraburkholderia caribensis]|uniref:hypothetical protein n=1 Tax=Paraburkholderia caribensis TaxID=75105 RepID=UPI001CB1DF82|nr:hypothetical protein [Paraburkholderia caribensis]CAG9250803.1 conserved hypothetical protein [Paraburkholderia caribensis]